MKITKRTLAFGTVLAMVGVAFVAILLSQPQDSSSSSAQSVTNEALKIPSKPAAVAYVPGLPQRIIIPKIGVNAPLDSLGLTTDGDLDAPKDITNAGWYNAGPRAGSPGSAVIDGHFGGTANNPAVFDNLHSLQTGDHVNVIDSDNKTHVFVVTGTKIFQPDQNATEVFKSVDTKSHLNLITCQGNWDSRKETYSTRLVVFTDLLIE